MPTSRSVLFFFLDGIGVGPPDPAVNPFLTAKLPTLSNLLDHALPVLDDTGTVIPFHAGGQKGTKGPGFPSGESPTRLIPLDALMGMDGLPQSGTGHTALFTGENAALLYGRHFGPWVPVPIRPIMMEENILSRAQRKGFSTVFANAYPSHFIHRAWTKRPAGPPLAAKGAGLLTRTEDHLARGQAVSSEMVNEAWRTRLELTHLPEITAGAAGRNLAAIAAGADLTLFAHYSTDTAGHKKTLQAGAGALERVDAFLAGLLSALDPNCLLVLASDHGNIEDVTKGHTRNPTFNLLHGPGAGEMAEGLQEITDIAQAVLRYLTDGA